MLLSREDIEHLVRPGAGLTGVPVQLMAAMAVVESGGHVYAYNPEPRYRWLWDVRHNKPYRIGSAAAALKSPPRDFPVLAGDRDQEFWGQQASWGLWQLMGAVCRERGFDGPYLPEVCTPTINAALACKHVAQYARRYRSKYGWAGVCRAYNGGGYACVRNTNPEYPAKVLAVLGGSWPA